MKFNTLLYQGKTNDCCLIIPVINEGDRLKKLLNKINILKIYEICDIFIVDGGSSDDSICINYLKLNRITGVIQMRSREGGLSAQLQSGYSSTIQYGYKYFITIDGNNKDDPSSIQLFLDKLKEGYDFVQGSRFINGGKGINTPWVRLFAIRLIHAPLLSIASGFHWTDTTQGYRGYSRELLMSNKISPLRECLVGYSFLPYISCKAPRVGYKCIEVPTTRTYPKGIVPTKINSPTQYISLVKSLIFAILGRYDPRQ